MSRRGYTAIMSLLLVLALLIGAAACNPGPTASGGGTGTPGSSGGTPATGGGGSGSTPAGGKLSGKIVFVSDRDGADDIYVMNADGSNVRRLLATPDPDDMPRWSPDGSKIAFQAEDAGYNSVYVVNADGTGLKQLTTHQSGDCGNPSWSPDGKKLAFFGQATGDRDIYVMNADGTGVKPLTKDYYTDISPAWSPDGTKIAFATDKSGEYGLAVMNADGSGRKDFPAAEDKFPRWSADGKYLIFQSKLGVRGNQNVCSLNIESGEVKYLTGPAYFGSGPQWVGNGQYILFWGNKSTNRDVFLMPTGGDTPIQLTNHAKDDYSPDWIAK